MQKGFIIFYTTLLALGLTIATSAGIYLLAFSNAKVAQNAVWSSQSYYAAESGIEDATLRIKNLLPYPASYSFTVGPAQTTVTVSANGNTRTIESDGQQQNRVRKLQAVLTVSNSIISFPFGVQVGNRGLSMGNGSSIIGNIFSNGDIEGGDISKSTVTGTAQAAGSSEIGDITVNGDATANSLSSCKVGGTASYVSSINNCTATSTIHISQQLAAQNLPISQSQIDTWENTAAAGGTLNGFTVGNGGTSHLGPKKIAGNLTLGNTSTLVLTGVVWVTGTINFGNNVTIVLDPSFQTQSGLLIVDAPTNIGNGVSLGGSGQDGSDLMILGTYGSGTALTIGNTIKSDIFYASQGTISVQNGFNAREVVGVGLTLGNNVSIQYQFGIGSFSFSPGPGGSFQVNSWKEIQ